ncbi:MAG TPA: alkaline phosphatase family protein [Verrucomicrobiae bacterium]|nr:alkaline phosphatase family protein [Verrucomicrobiae bacterium]
MSFSDNKCAGAKRNCAALFLVFLLLAVSTGAQPQNRKPAAARPIPQPARPKLVVVIVVDQMRADYVDKFRSQWSGGLKRLVEEGAWFRAAAYPYAATKTCVGHATISTGAFPASHGMVANDWWDRDTQKMVTCTSDPNVKNVAYADGTTKGGDSAWRMLLPSFAEELKFQSAPGTRVVTFSLKARAAITLAGHKADAATWFDNSTGSWVTSSPYSTQPFIEDYAKKHPVTEDYGKTWSLSLPKDAYWYDEKAKGAAAVSGWGDDFPFALRGKEGSGGPDEAFYTQWSTSPFADTYLTRLAETAVDSMNLGKAPTTDYLGISYSSTDSVGHTFGPRSWEIQDMLVRLDKDLGELFAHLDEKVGKGDYVVVLTADHGVAPNPADMDQTGFDAGVLNLLDLQSRLENALLPLNLGEPAIAKIAGNDVYFAPGVYGELHRDPRTIKALMDAAMATPGVAAVFLAEELGGGFQTVSQTRTAAQLSFYPARSGDILVLQKPYWVTGSSPNSKKQYTGTSHGTPYDYDQRVPLLFMGFGIQPGEYFQAATPADIAPTLGALTGITLATHDGHALSEALQASSHKP